MLLGIVLLLMTAAAVFAVLWPLRVRPLGAGGSDLDVYRDQLAEVDRDHSAGLIPEREAEAARVEVSRRLLAAADAASMPAASGGERRRRVAAIAALVLMPFGAAVLYLALGSPQLPGQPLSARANDGSIEMLIAKVENHLATNPDDGRGWEVIGPVYLRQGRFDDAVRARRNAMRLLGVTATREADLGEALTAVANGMVTPEAKAAFERALKLDPENPRALYFTGLAAEQDGRAAEAAGIWRNLLAKASDNAPWVEFVRQSLSRVEAAAPSVAAPAPAAPAAAAPGPSAADVTAAQDLSDQQRTEMIRGMVDRLAERLSREGSDVEGWLRLLRSYIVLGDHEKAEQTVADARRALAGEPDKLQRLEELVKGLGLKG